MNKEAIKLTPAMIQHLLDLHQEMQIVELRINEFLKYCRKELNVPADWVFTGQVDGDAFVPSKGDENASKANQD